MKRLSLTVVLLGLAGCTGSLSTKGFTLDGPGFHWRATVIPPASSTTVDPAEMVEWLVDEGKALVEKFLPAE